MPDVRATETIFGEDDINERLTTQRDDDVPVAPAPDHNGRPRNSGARIIPPVPSVPPISAVPFQFASGHSDPTFIPAPQIFVVEDEDEVVDRLFPQEQPDLEEDPVPVPPTIQLQPDALRDVDHYAYAEQKEREPVGRTVEDARSAGRSSICIHGAVAVYEMADSPADSPSIFNGATATVSELEFETAVVHRTMRLDEVEVAEADAVPEAGEERASEGVPDAVSRQARRRMVLSLITCSLLAVSITFLARPIAGALFKHDASLYVELIQVSAWVAPLLAILLPMESALRSTGQRGPVARNRILTTLFSVGTMVALVSVLGIRGAGYSVVASAAVSTLFLMPAFARSFPDVFPGVPGSEPRLTQKPAT